MLLLASTTDALQIVTSAAAPIVVHTSWVDTNTGTGTITPGRTNSLISSAATTSVAGSPAAGVQRNVKTLHVRNNAGPSCDVTVQHTDGTVVVSLYKRTLISGDVIEYTDQGGFAEGAGGGPTVSQRVFTASGSYVPTPEMTSCIIECIGGGGGGGGVSADSVNTYVGGGGGSGGYSRKIATAAQIGASQVVTIGAGGAGGGAVAVAGGASSVGTLCVANGGGGGTASIPANSSNGGQGGAPGIGDIAAAGAPGGGGAWRLSYTWNGEGGSSIFGGGGVSVGGVGDIAGGAASAYGSGGGGATSAAGAVGAVGGNGSPGIVIITEYLRK